MDFYLRNFVLSNVFFCLLLVGGMVGLCWFGHRMGRRSYAGDEAATAGWATLEAAMLGLFGLLMAFSFSGTAERFQNRRALILQQAQAIGTAFDRIELLDEPARGRLKSLFREYVDFQLEIYKESKYVEGLFAKLDALEAKGGEIYAQAAAACREERHRHLAPVIPPAINDMLDAALARRASITIHLPPVIYGLLFSMALGTGLLAGFGMTPAPRINWFHAAIFASFVAATIFVILDMDFPRAGLFHVEAADEILRVVRRGMG